MRMGSRLGRSPRPGHRSAGGWRKVKWRSGGLGCVHMLNVALFKGTAESEKIPNLEHTRLGQGIETPQGVELNYQVEARSGRTVKATF